jgi:ribosomal protein L30, bacterial/organelle
MAKEIMITLKKSSIGSNKKQKATLKALGLTKINKTVTKESKDFILGMVKKVEHLVEVKEV